MDSLKRKTRPLGPKFNESVPLSRCFLLSWIRTTSSGDKVCSGLGPGQCSGYRKSSGCKKVLINNRLLVFKEHNYFGFASIHM